MKGLKLIRCNYGSLPIESFNLNHTPWFRHFFDLSVLGHLASTRIHESIASMRIRSISHSTMLNNKLLCGIVKKKKLSSKAASDKWLFTRSPWRPCGSHIGETAAMLVYQTNPVGVHLFSYLNTFFCSNQFTWPLVTWVKTLGRLNIGLETSLKNWLPFVIKCVKNRVISRHNFKQDFGQNLSTKVVSHFNNNKNVKSFRNYLANLHQNEIITPGWRSFKVIWTGQELQR